MFFGYKIQVQKNQLFVFFSDTNRSYDPLAYPLFFPYGTDGWNCNVKSLNLENKTNVSLAQYVQFNMMKRDHHNFLHDGRKLYQQWIIDQYEKMETSRLQFFSSSKILLL